MGRNTDRWNLKGRGGEGVSDGGEKRRRRSFHPR